MSHSFINFSTSQIKDCSGNECDFEPFGENLVFQEPSEEFFEWVFEEGNLLEDIETPQKDNFIFLSSEGCSCVEMGSYLNLSTYFEIGTERRIFVVKNVDGQCAILRSKNF